MTKRTAGRMIRVRLIPAVLLLLGLSSGPLPAQDLSLPLGTPAPQATVQDLDGNPVQLLDLLEEGKPTLLEFWATWCGNCKLLQPQLDQIQERWGSRVNLVAVAVAVSQTREQVRAHVEEHDVAYPYVWDEEGEAVTAYDIPGTAIVVVLDSQGQVAYTGSGRDQDLVGTMERLLGGHP